MELLQTLQEQFLHTTSQENLFSSLPFAVIGLILSLLICFLGYRLTKILAALVAFALGAALGVFISEHFFDSETITILFAVIGGFFVAMLAVYIYSMGVFVLGFFCGVSLSSPLVFRLIANTVPAYIIVGSVGLVVAILSVIFLKPFMIAVMAGQGGVWAAQYITALIAYSAVWLLPALSVVLIALGILVQFLTTKNYKLARGGDRISKY